MTQTKPPAQINPPEAHDPYRLRSLEQILSIFDGGGLLQQIMEGHRNLLLELAEHKDEHGSKGCQGSMTITVNYAPTKTGDVSMGATANFKGPKKPPASAAAYMTESGELTLFSPMLAQMSGGIRDVTEPNHDPDTGEVRDI